tara:strand:+ start:379 stop:708 length:330 start_codon:yes stop_codon:yes gene_type:complete
MRKAQEIEILRNAVAQLGANSYCGPWLADQLPSIEDAITSDFPPENYAMSIREARIHCDKLLSAAKHECAKMERDSAAQAKARFEAGTKELARLKESTREVLRECLALL